MSGSAEIDFRQLVHQGRQRAYSIPVSAARRLLAGIDRQRRWWFHASLSTGAASDHCPALTLVSFRISLKLRLEIESGVCLLGGGGGGGDADAEVGLLAHIEFGGQ